MERIYGQWQESSTAVPVANADHVLGIKLICDSQRRSDWIEIQYRTADGDGLGQIRLDFLNAIFLMSCLKAAQLDSGLEFPEDPRATPSPI